MTRQIVRLSDVLNKEFIGRPEPYKEDDGPIGIVILGIANISDICWRAVEYDDGTLEAGIYVLDRDGKHIVISHGELLKANVSGFGHIRFL